MGVKGLFQFLKRFQKDIHIPQYLQGKSVGIDIFWYLHKSKGDMFVLQNDLLPIIKNSLEAHFVFDGKVSLNKKDELENNLIKRKEIIQSIYEIDKFLKYPFNNLNSNDRYHIVSYLNELKRQVWQPTPEFIVNVKGWLQSKKCIIHQAEYEADDILCELERESIINIIITNDSDILILGSNNVLRPISPLRGSVYIKNNIITKLGFTFQQWNDFMYLCRHMKKNDIALAYSLISAYKELDYVLEKYYNIYKDSLISDISFEDNLKMNN